MILEYIVTTPAQTFSTENLAKYFESENRNGAKNTLYNELIYRGYDVKIGYMENGEIDFIALKDGKKILSSMLLD